MHTHSDSILHNHVTLTFDLRVNAGQVTSVLIARAVFFLDCEQTDGQTQTKCLMQLITLPVPQLLLAWVMKDCNCRVQQKDSGGYWHWRADVKTITIESLTWDSVTEERRSDDYLPTNENNDV